MLDSLRSLIKTRLLLSELDRRAQSKDISSAAEIKQLVEKNPELQSALKEFASEAKVEKQNIKGAGSSIQR